MTSKPKLTLSDPKLFQSSEQNVETLAKGFMEDTSASELEKAFPRFHESLRPPQCFIFRKKLIHDVTGQIVQGIDRGQARTS